MRGSAVRSAVIEKMSAVLCSELSLMRHALQGAYDFTHYLISGRCLFSHFHGNDPGRVSGLVKALYWAIENFVRAWTRTLVGSDAIKTLFSTSLFWLKYLGYPLRKNSASPDGAICTFLFDSRTERLLRKQNIREQFNLKLCGAFGRSNCRFSGRAAGCEAYCQQFCFQRRQFLGDF